MNNTRHILNLAVARAMGKDIALAPDTQPLHCLAGNEFPIAQQLDRLILDDRRDIRTLALGLERCTTIDDVLRYLDRQQAASRQTFDLPYQSSLFAAR